MRRGMHIKGGIRFIALLPLRHLVAKSDGLVGALSMQAQQRQASQSQPCTWSRTKYPPTCRRCGSCLPRRTTHRWGNAAGAREHIDGEAAVSFLQRELTSHVPDAHPPEAKPNWDPPPRRCQRFLKARLLVRPDPAGDLGARGRRGVRGLVRLHCAEAAKGAVAHGRQHEERDDDGLGGVGGGEAARKGCCLHCSATRAGPALSRP